jgi:hypothetical protein
MVNLKVIFQHPREWAETAIDLPQLLSLQFVLLNLWTRIRGVHNESSSMVDWKSKYVSGWDLNSLSFVSLTCVYKTEQMGSLSFHDQGTRNLLPRVSWLFPTNRRERECIWYWSLVLKKGPTNGLGNKMESQDCKEKHSQCSQRDLSSTGKQIHVTHRLFSVLWRKSPECELSIRRQREPGKLGFLGGTQKRNRYKEKSFTKKWVPLHWYEGSEFNHFHFCISSTQAPVQWVPGLLSQGLKRAWNWLLTSN